ncbi:MAG: hypothetical protein HWN80_05925 [Candidatus Lokiarchaeota archaeon]|nr:hypothetical protein [Candidatus Lokiarchaeota archaeon]
MKPPICCICNKDLEYPNDGGLIYFKKRPSDKKWDKLMEENGMVGHPPYAEWFCKDHFEKANELKELPIDRAMKLLET